MMGIAYIHSVHAIPLLAYRYDVVHRDLMRPLQIRTLYTEVFLVCPCSKQPEKIVGRWFTLVREDV